MQTSADAIDDNRITVQLPFVREAARTARRMMGTYLRSAGVDQHLVDDASLVVSELMTNGIQHGLPSTSGQIEVSWRLLEDRLEITVLDQGEVISPVRPTQARADSDHGRGLSMIEHLCSRWWVEHDGGTRVVAELARS